MRRFCTSKTRFFLLKSQLTFCCWQWFYWVDAFYLIEKVKFYVFILKKKTFKLKFFVCFCQADSTFIVLLSPLNHLHHSQWVIWTLWILRFIPAKTLFIFTILKPVLYEGGLKRLIKFLNMRIFLQSKTFLISLISKPFSKIIIIDV